jgi:multidrug efflux pump subunit AcrA (membrane-fusion protein)
VDDAFALSKSDVSIDTVHREDVRFEIAAPGRMVPEHQRILAAIAGGRVESLPLPPGAQVAVGDTIVVLSSPDVSLQFLLASQQLLSAQTSLRTTRSSLHQQRLAHEGVLLELHLAKTQVQRELAVAEALAEKELISAVELELLKQRASTAARRYEVEQARLRELLDAEAKLLSMLEEQVENLTLVVNEHRLRLSSMSITAREAGVIQSISVELGQWVNPGTELARTATPGRLKAVLQVPEDEARRVVIGDSVTIDTRTALSSGLVARIEPVVVRGGVAVEVSSTSSWPSTARSDMAVEGRIRGQPVRNRLTLRRTPYVMEGQRLIVFVCEESCNLARRREVQVGIVSHDRMEIASGLREGEVVFVTAAADGVDAAFVRLR